MRKTISILLIVSTFQSGLAFGQAAPPVEYRTRTTIRETRDLDAYNSTIDRYLATCKARNEIQRLLDSDDEEISLDERLRLTQALSDGKTDFEDWKINLARTTADLRRNPGFMRSGRTLWESTLNSLDLLAHGMSVKDEVSYNQAMPALLVRYVTEPENRECLFAFAIELSSQIQPTSWERANKSTLGFAEFLVGTMMVWQGVQLYRSVGGIQGLMKRGRQAKALASDAGEAVNDGVQAASNRVRKWWDIRATSRMEGTPEQRGVAITRSTNAPTSAPAEPENPNVNRIDPAAVDRAWNRTIPAAPEASARAPSQPAAPKGPGTSVVHVPRDAPMTEKEVLEAYGRMGISKDALAELSKRQAAERAATRAAKQARQAMRSEPNVEAPAPEVPAPEAPAESAPSTEPAAASQPQKNPFAIVKYEPPRSAYEMFGKQSFAKKQLTQFFRYVKEMAGQLKIPAMTGGLAAWLNSLPKFALENKMDPIAVLRPYQQALIVLLDKNAFELKQGIDSTFAEMDRIPDTDNAGFVAEMKQNGAKLEKRLRELKATYADLDRDLKHFMAATPEYLGCQSLQEAGVQDGRDYLEKGLHDCGKRLEDELSGASKADGHDDYAVGRALSANERAAKFIRQHQELSKVYEQQIREIDDWAGKHGFNPNDKINVSLYPPLVNLTKAKAALDKHEKTLRDARALQLIP